MQASELVSVVFLAVIKGLSNIKNKSLVFFLNYEWGPIVGPYDQKDSKENLNYSKDGGLEHSPMETIVST